MNPEKESHAALPSAQKARFSVWLCVLGILVIVCWISITALVGALMGMASLMANDSGAASNHAHLLLILGVGAGELLVMVAGIPGGLAIFWRGRRRLLLWTFGALLVVGVACVGASLMIFFNAARAGLG